MEGKEIDRNSVPLKFEDIVDKKIYDKMRPPKPGGKIYIINYRLDICLREAFNKKKHFIIDIRQ